MASEPTMSNEKSSPNSSEGESESDTESDSSDDSETMESLSSFDQSEEEDHLSSEDVVEEPASGQLPCESGMHEEKPSEVEATDESSHDLEKSGEATPMDEFPSLFLPPPPSFSSSSSLPFSFSLNNISTFTLSLFYIK